MPPQDVRRFSQFKPDSHNLVREEERMKGSISWAVYKDYVTTGGAALFIVVAIMFSVALSSHAGGDYWLSVWTTDRIGYVFLYSELYLVKQRICIYYLINRWSGDMYLLIYAAFGLLELVLQSVGSFSLVGFGVRAASQLHNRMVTSMANAKIGFFDAYVLFVFLSIYEILQNCVAIPWEEL